MKSRFFLARAWMPALIFSSLLLTRIAFAGNTWDGGGGGSFLWSNNANWSPDGQPGYGTLTFSGATGTTNIVDQNYSMNIVLWTDSSPWTLNQSNSAVVSLFDNSGAQAKVENQSSGLVTINAPITFGATAGANFGEINAVNGNITFGTGTLTVNGSILSDIRLYGSSRIVNFNNTVNASGKDFGIATSGTGHTINIGGSFTASNFSVMNGGTLNLNSGGTLNSTGVRLGSDFVGSGNINNTLGATFQLTNAAGGQTFAGTLNAGGGNTSNALVLNSLNTSGTNTLSGNLFLDSNLTITQSSGGTATINGTTLDLKAQTLSLKGAGGSVNISGVLSNSSAGGQLVVGTNGLAGSGGTVTLSAANTYSGQTFVRNGTLALASGGTVANSTIRLGSTSGTSVDASINLTSVTGGQTISSTINPVTTSGSGTLLFASQNTSGTNTFSGHLGLDRDLTVAQSSGGILALTQARAGGAGTTTGTDIKGFTLSLSPAANGKINYSGDIYNSASNGNVVTGGGGSVNLSGANTYSGTTVINNGTLQASAAGALGGTSNVTINTGGTLLLTNTATTNRINNSATITMAGGNITFNGNVTEGPSPGTGALTLTANSIIDFAGGNGVINFGNSSGAAWTGGTTLSIYNWDGLPAGNGNDQIIFGIDNNALTGSQLAQVNFYSGNGSGFLGTATILSDGELVPIPEPGAVFTTLGLLGLVGYRERRRRRG
jgi:fibronectin-binding autotransporter adhesin